MGLCITGIIHVTQAFSLSTKPNDLLGENIPKKTKGGVHSATQFNSIVAWLKNINLFEKDETSKVLDKDGEGEKASILAPIIGYVTPLALAILVRHFDKFSKVKCHVVNFFRVKLSSYHDHSS